MFPLKFGDGKVCPKSALQATLGALNYGEFRNEHEKVARTNDRSQDVSYGVHMKASWIFSANDVIANLGVILAGLLVALTGSRYPDLVIGFVIGLIVLNGARRILQLKS